MLAVESPLEGRAEGISGEVIDQHGGPRKRLKKTPVQAYGTGERYGHQKFGQPLGHIETIRPARATSNRLLHKRRRNSFTHPDPWKLGEPAGGPSPALKGTLSPFEGERERERGPNGLGPQDLAAAGSGDVVLNLSVCDVCIRTRRWNGARSRTAMLYFEDIREPHRLPSSPPQSPTGRRNVQATDSKRVPVMGCSTQATGRRRSQLRQDVSP